MVFSQWMILRHIDLIVELQHLNVSISRTLHIHGISLGNVRDSVGRLIGRNVAVHVSEFLFDYDKTLIDES